MFVYVGTTTNAVSQWSDFHTIPKSTRKMGKRTIEVGSKVYNVAEEQPLKGLKNGTRVQLVSVAINSLGEAVSDDEVRVVVNKANEGEEYPQYYCGYKNGDVPVIIPVGAIGRAFDNEEYQPNELTSKLGEAFGYTELAQKGAILTASVRRGYYTFSGDSKPSVVRSIAFTANEDCGTPINVVDAEKVNEFIALIKSARDYRP